LTPDPAELLIKEAREKTRRRRLRWASLFTLLVAACLIAAGIVHYTSSPTRTSSGRGGTSAKAMTCPDARVKILGETGMSGAAVYAGLIVRTSVTSSPACPMSGYPIIGAQLTSHATAMASDVRETYLGGGMTTTTRLPRLSITSRPRVASFTIQMVTGNGPTCPRINAIKVTLAGSRETLTTRPIFNAGGLALPMKFIYCGELQVTPLVKGSSGKN
jgi:hypothetical protein